jgi:integrase
MIKKISTTLHIYSPTTEEVENNTPISDHNGEIMKDENCETLYFAMSPEEDYAQYIIGDEDYDPMVYSNFTFVMNSDGSLWEEANLYLLHKIRNDPYLLIQDSRISSETIKKHAKTLQAYKEFCDLKDNEKNDGKGLTEEEKKTEAFWMVAKKPTMRPNMIYKRYLEQRIGNGKEELAVSTVKNELYPITAFYKFVQEELDMQFDTLMPGRDFQALVAYGDGGGRRVQANEANQVRNAQNNDDGYIKDGGNVIPLLPEEQEAVLAALRELGNIEMLLAHVFSLATGARKDTTFTLRLRHFINTLPTDYSDQGWIEWLAAQKKIDADREYDLTVGTGTLIDSKGTIARYNLKVPGWLILKFRIYIMSKRAVERRQKIKFPQKDPLDEYVFITSRNQPYYVAKSDPNSKNYRNKPVGNQVNGFHCDFLKLKLREKGHTFEFKFHFLRASYCTNIIKGLPESDVQKRMGHRSIETTRLYVKYQKNKQSREEALNNHYSKLKGWMKDEQLCDRPDFKLD